MGSQEPKGAPRHPESLHTRSNHGAEPYSCGTGPEEEPLPGDPRLELHLQWGDVEGATVGWGLGISEKRLACDGLPAVPSNK